MPRAAGAAVCVTVRRFSVSSISSSSRRLSSSTTSAPSVSAAYRCCLRRAAALAGGASEGGTTKDLVRVSSPIFFFFFSFWNLRRGRETKGVKDEQPHSRNHDPPPTHNTNAQHKHNHSSAEIPITYCRATPVFIWRGKQPQQPQRPHVQTKKLSALAITVPVLSHTAVEAITGPTPTPRTSFLAFSSCDASCCCADS